MIFIFSTKRLVLKNYFLLINPNMFLMILITVTFYWSPCTKPGKWDVNILELVGSIVSFSTVWVMVFNATFEKIYWLYRDGRFCWSLTNYITKCCIEYTLPFELTTLVVISPDCIGGRKSNYHAIMTVPN